MAGIEIELGPLSHLSENRISDSVARRFAKQQKAEVDAYYESHNLTVPGIDGEGNPTIRDANSLKNAFKAATKIVCTGDNDNPKSIAKLTAFEVSAIIRKVIPFCMAPAANQREIRRADGKPVVNHGTSGLNQALFMYDWERGIYVDPVNKLGEYMGMIKKGVTSAFKNDVLTTLQCGAMLDETDGVLPYLPFRAMPRYMVVVGNGVYNLLTHELEPFDPRYMAFSSISIDFKPEMADHPNRKHYGNLDFESMCKSFANGNPQRIRLLEQICKYMVVGKAPADSGFIVYGEGGDGKSTFFEDMMGSVIGSENVAPLSFDDLDDENKLATTESAKLILGTDNNEDVFVRNSRRVKQLITHDSFSVNRKYLAPRTISTHGAFVQLVNSMPRFAENNAAMMRRFTAVHAENSYVQQGVANDDLRTLVANQDFSEHVLAFILTKLPYYRDFNQCDVALLIESAMESDTVALYLDTLINEGFFDHGVRIIPFSHLYNSYVDWMYQNSAGNHVVGTRKFSNRAHTILRKLGFATETKTMRVNTGKVRSEYKYETDLFGELGVGDRFQKAVDGSKTCKVLIRDEESTSINAHEVAIIPSLHQKDERCSVYDYLGISMDIAATMTDEEIDAYLAEIEKPTPDPDPDPEPTNPTDGPKADDSETETVDAKTEPEVIEVDVETEEDEEEDVNHPADGGIPTDLRIAANTDLGETYNRGDFARLDAYDILFYHTDMHEPGESFDFNIDDENGKSVRQHFVIPNEDELEAMRVDLTRMSALYDDIAAQIKAAETFFDDSVEFSDRLDGFCSMVRVVYGALRRELYKRGLKEELKLSKYDTRQSDSYWIENADTEDYMVPVCIDGESGEVPFVEFVKSIEEAD